MAQLWASRPPPSTPRRLALALTLTLTLTHTHTLTQAGLSPPSKYPSPKEAFADERSELRSSTLSTHGEGAASKDAPPTQAPPGFARAGSKAKMRAEAAEAGAEAETHTPQEEVDEMDRC